METMDEEQPRGNQLMRRGFSGTELAVSSGSTEALVAKERASVEARWIMAMRCPRDMDTVRQLVLKECRRPGFADAAVYALPRGGKSIEGLSIRFAEVAVRCMGNLQPDVVTVYDDDRTRMVRCTVTDFETNVTWSKDLTIKKTVERRQLGKGQRPLGERTNSYGDRVYLVEATDDEVIVKENALVSKTLRTLILRCIPGHIQDEALKLCNSICADKAAKDPDAERVRMLDAFAAINVLPGDLEELLGHPTTQMQPAELERLRKIYAAISEGHATWLEVIADARENKAPATTTSAQPAQGATNAPTEQAAPTPAAAPAERKGGPRSEKPKGGNAGLKAALGSTQATAGQPTGGNPTSKLDQAAANARARDADREQRKVEDATTEPAWMSGRYEKGAKVGPAQLPPETPPPDDGNEYRGCNDCGVLIEVPMAEAAGSLCYACRQA